MGHKNRIPANILVNNSQSFVSLFKALSHEGRFAILLQLNAGEMSVSQLEQATNQRQTVVSQQLARLRQDNLVDFRRQGKAVYYSICDKRLTKVLRHIGTLAQE